MSTSRCEGFSLLELLVVVVVIGVLASMATPFYLGVVQSAQVKSCVADLQTISRVVDAYVSQHGRVPDSLAEVGVQGYTDPWGRPYQFQRLDYGAEDRPGEEEIARRRSSGRPANSDYDLYTSGADGKAMVELDHPESRDDVLRGHDGAFLGTVPEFDPLREDH